jgi:hypothetical protein
MVPARSPAPGWAGQVRARQKRPLMWLLCSVAEDAVEAGLEAVCRRVAQIGTTGLGLGCDSYANGGAGAQVELLVTWACTGRYELLATTRGPRGVTPMHLAALLPDGGAVAAALIGAPSRPWRLTVRVMRQKRGASRQAALPVSKRMWQHGGSIRCGAATPRFCGQDSVHMHGAPRRQPLLQAAVQGRVLAAHKPPGARQACARTGARRGHARATAARRPRRWRRPRATRPRSSASAPSWPRSPVRARPPRRRGRPPRRQLR